MKITLKYIRFSYEDNAGNKYDVICPAGKWGNNDFVVYVNGSKKTVHTPRGGHVNKTSALRILKNAINNA